jgi:biotin synthase
LHQAAYAVKTREVGKTVYFRGLIEMSNVCYRNCLYCGIRQANQAVERFTLSADEIIAAAVQARDFDYGSIVLQGGENRDPQHIDFISEVLRDIHAATDNTLGVTLSLGQQSPETYRRWRAAGAHRYLLRIETTDQDLYAQLHPDHPDQQGRRACLDSLRETGYQVGTGVMIGLPGQTIDSLAADLLFFKQQDVDMIGMGPFIPHDDTPMADQVNVFDSANQMRLGLNMIACARLLLPDANIAATTALQALHAQGREQGLLAGANVMMPNVTHTRHRASYQLYNGKPNLQENAESCRRNLSDSITAIGEYVGLGRWGDSPRAVKRLSDRRTP